MSGTTQAQQSLRLRGHVYAVLVFFCSQAVCAKGATRSEERVVGERLRRERCVRQVVFTSKAEALTKFKKEHPKLAGGLPGGVGNPLPDSFKVTPDKPSCAATIASEARAAHWPGVQHVGLARRH